MRRAVTVACALAIMVCVGLGVRRTGSRAPEASAPLREGRALIDRARATGIWSPVEYDALRALLPRLAPAERGEVLRSLARAMNDGEVVLRDISRPQ